MIIVGGLLFLCTGHCSEWTRCMLSACMQGFGYMAKYTCVCVCVCVFVCVCVCVCVRCVCLFDCLMEVAKRQLSIKYCRLGFFKRMRLFKKTARNMCFKVRCA